MRGVSATLVTSSLLLTIACGFTPTERACDRFVACGAVDPSEEDRCKQTIKATFRESKKASVAQGRARIRKFQGAALDCTLGSGPFEPDNDACVQSLDCFSKRGFSPDALLGGGRGGTGGAAGAPGTGGSAAGGTGGMGTGGSAGGAMGGAAGGGGTSAGGASGMGGASGSAGMSAGGAAGASGNAGAGGT